MPVSKRCYRGRPEFLQDLDIGFNGIRPRSATLSEDRDGSRALLVGWWDDWSAAALWLLVNSGVRGNMLKPAVIDAKVGEIARMAGNRAEELRPEWLGEVIMSEGGATATVIPVELQEAGTV